MDIHTRIGMQQPWIQLKSCKNYDLQFLKVISCVSAISISAGWEYVGDLCSGLQEDGTGIVWECPLLVKLPLLSSQPSPISTDAASDPGQHIKMLNGMGSGASSSPPQPSSPPQSPAALKGGLEMLAKGTSRAPEVGGAASQYKYW